MTTSPRGYTLLELIVSVGLFSIVMLVVTGAYLAIVSYDREARFTNEIVATLSFATESMVRNIRTGTNYSCGAGDGTCSQFSFTDAAGDTVIYRLKSDGTIGQCTNTSCVDTYAVPLTDTRITVSSLIFYVRGSSSADTVQPRVTISIRGTVNTDSGKSTAFAIESGATQRIIDL